MLEKFTWRRHFSLQMRNTCDLTETSKDLWHSKGIKRLFSLKQQTLNRKEFWKMSVIISTCYLHENRLLNRFLQWCIFQAVAFPRDIYSANECIYLLKWIPVSLSYKCMREIFLFQHISPIICIPKWPVIFRFVTVEHTLVSDRYKWILCIQAMNLE